MWLLHEKQPRVIQWLNTLRSMVFRWYTSEKHMATTTCHLWGLVCGCEGACTQSVNLLVIIIYAQSCLLFFLRQEGNTTIRPALAALAVTWRSKREKKCIWQVKLHTGLSILACTPMHSSIRLIAWYVPTPIFLSLLSRSSGCEVWHPLCKQAARAERRLRVSWGSK